MELIFIASPDGTTTVSKRRSPDFRKRRILYCARYLRLPDYQTPPPLSPTPRHLSAGSCTVPAQRPGAATEDHRSAIHTSALANMIASENFTFTRDVSTKTRSASTGAPNPPLCFLTGRRGQDKYIEARLGIGRVHARRLYAGYATPESLVEVSEERIGRLSDRRWRGMQSEGLRWVVRSVVLKYAVWFNIHECHMLRYPI